MTHSLTPKALTLACALAMSAIASAQAADVQKDETKAKEEVHALAPVTVDEEMDKNGVVNIRAAELQLLPSSTGTISDALRGNSFIQYDSSSRAGGQGAEITPPLISIRGGRNYENSFLINGLSNNNLLNPSGYASDVNALTNDGLDRMPTGDAQAIMLDTDLLESLTVLSENISAEYGNFGGGVVNAKIRDAQSDRWHAKFWTRHTRDSWAKIHITPEQEKVEEHPLDKDRLNKEFKNTNVGIVFEGPLFDGKLGAMVSYQKSHTSAPVYQKQDSSYRGKVFAERKSKRDKENFMLRLNSDKDADFYVSSTLIYSPYEANYFIDKNRDAERKVKGGGWNWSLNTITKTRFGSWTNDFGFAQNEVNWDSNSNIKHSWYYKNDTDGRNGVYGPTWGGGDEGMSGDRNTKQTTFNFKSVMNFEPFTVMNTKHTVKAGIEGLYTKVKYDSEGYTAFSNYTKYGQPAVHHLQSEEAGNRVIVGDISNGIWAGKQWLDRKSVNDPIDQEADYLTFSAFVEDAIQLERFTLRPGVRIDHDDITSNVNVAPRISFDLDVLNDRRFNINGGYNRYYGNQVLTHAISARSSYTLYKRDSFDGEWQLDTRDPENPYKAVKAELGDLDTPYSDEFVLGASANILNNTIFRIQAVKRDYKDQLQTEDGKLTNTGETQYEGITFTLEKGFDLGTYGRHYSELGVTNSKLQGTSSNWISSWTEENGPTDTKYDFDEEYIWIDGEKKAYKDLDANNFNSDWVVTFTHRSYFMDDRLRSTVLVRYESAADKIVRKPYDTHPNEVPGGKPYAVFETAENDAIFNTDLTLEYDLIKTVNSTLTLELQALNLFDHESLNYPDGTKQNDTASMGRQFWLGMSYTY